jgi:hypothetical protein
MANEEMNEEQLRGLKKLDEMMDNVGQPTMWLVSEEDLEKLRRLKRSKRKR